MAVRYSRCLRAGSRQIRGLLGRVEHWRSSSSGYYYLFPGQGSQYVGMCKDILGSSKRTELPAVATLFDLAEGVFGVDFRKMFLSGPQVSLDQTVNCQPAVVLASLAALHIHKERSEVPCCAAAGLSVGEITALIAAGCLTPEQGFALIKVRAEAMQEACDAERSCIFTVSRLNEETLRDIIQSTGDTHSSVAQAAIFLSPSQVSVSGSLNRVNAVIEEASKLGAVSKRIRVAGAFHSELMASAVPRLKEALDKIPMKDPEFPLYSNVTARPYDSVEEIKENLARQVTEPVLWHQTIYNMMHDRLNIDESGNTRDVRFIEIGPKRQLKSLLRKIDVSAFRNCDSVPV